MPTIHKMKLLLLLAQERMWQFCKLNNLYAPEIRCYIRENWHFGPCAFYRPDTDVQRKYGHTGINICLEKCARPCTNDQSRNWSWPGNITDRTPYGVIAHELGHHVDWCLSEDKGAYYGDYSIKLRKATGERPITSYCPNDAEFFAELFRLYITNPALLNKVRPRTYAALCERLKPVGVQDQWLENLSIQGLGSVPKKIPANIGKHIAKARSSQRS